MPNVTLHLVLADRVLEEWRSEPAAAPFDPYAPHLVNAFHQGAFGPDLGYFPGGHPFLSDLAHYVRTGDLTRSLLRTARTPAERAFAWGWLTHVLGDQAIHPLVGCAVGEFLHGERAFMSACADLVSHVRVEVGLDAHYSHREPVHRARVPRPVFDGASVGYLAAAYRDTYGVAIDPQLFLVSHHHSVRMARRALVSIGVMGDALAARPTSPAVTGARWLLERTLVLMRNGLDFDSMLMAYVNPVSPPPWLVADVDEVVASFPERIRHVRAQGLETLPHYDLDSGEVAREATANPVARRAMARLRRLGGGTPRAPRADPAGSPGPATRCA